MDDDSARAFYLTEVWPRLDEELRERARRRWPCVRVEPEAGYTPLGELPLRMVCGLTGSGKSTALAALRAGTGHRYREDLPSRRDLADLVVIPAAQMHRGQAPAAVSDRAARFRWTQIFAQEVCHGGSATAFSGCIYRHDGQTPLLSEGLRGAREIGAAPAGVFRAGASPNCGWTRSRACNVSPAATMPSTPAPPASPTWAICRPRSGSAPANCWPAARSARAPGDRRRRNAQLRRHPFAGDAANYRCLRMDALTPQQAAAALGEFLFAEADS